MPPQLSFKGTLNETSSGWTILVQAAGTKTGVVVHSSINCLTRSVFCALWRSSTKRVSSLTNGFHDVHIHRSISSLSHHALGWKKTVTHLSYLSLSLNNIHFPVPLSFFRLVLYGQRDHTPCALGYIKHDLPTLSGLKYTFLSFYIRLYSRLLSSFGTADSWVVWSIHFLATTSTHDCCWGLVLQTVMTSQTYPLLWQFCDVKWFLVVHGGNTTMKRAATILFLRCRRQQTPKKKLFLTCKKKQTKITNQETPRHLSVRPQSSIFLFVKVWLLWTQRLQMIGQCRT